MSVDGGIFVSAASIWEISIKHAIQKHKGSTMPFSGGQALEAFQSAGLYLLNITPKHAASVDALPPVHGDPFDRILVAQARQESLYLLTRDKILAGYGDFVMVV